MDIGIKEAEYWDMTLGELERAVESYKRVKKQQAQERASFDYALADLIGISVARIYSNSNKIPDISEVYPTLFDNQELQEKKQEKRMELSALRFKQFAESFNNNFNKGAESN